MDFEFLGELELVLAKSEQLIPGKIYEIRSSNYDKSNDEDSFIFCGTLLYIKNNVYIFEYLFKFRFGVLKILKKNLEDYLIMEIKVKPPKFIAEILSRLSKDFRIHNFEIKNINNEGVLFIDGKRMSSIYKERIDDNYIYMFSKENTEEALYQNLKNEVQEELIRRMKYDYRR